MRVLLTGATGFVGATLVSYLRGYGYIVRAALRRDSATDSCDERVLVGDIDETTDWEAALVGVDVVVHLAARVHVLGDSSDNDNLYHRCNALGTRRLAEASNNAGVKRFIFLSTVKVNGEESERAYTANDPPNPRDAYSASKLEGERALQRVTVDGPMDFAIVRPPLVYGPGVRANFERLMRWTARGVPLPLGAVRNRRSLVSIWNLCSLLKRLIEHPAGRGVWMVSDGEDVSTTELVRRMASVMHIEARLLPVPVGVLRFAGRVIGREAEVARLCGSLTVDISQTVQRLDWTPPVPLNEGIARTGKWFLQKGTESVA